MPAGIEAATKVPVGPVVKVRWSPVSLLMMSTGAAGTTAPDWSYTVPQMSPVGACAGAANVMNKHRTGNNRRNRRISFRTEGPAQSMLPNPIHTFTFEGPSHALNPHHV